MGDFIFVINDIEHKRKQSHSYNWSYLALMPRINIEAMTATGSENHGTTQLTERERETVYVYRPKWSRSAMDIYSTTTSWLCAHYISTADQSEREKWSQWAADTGEKAKGFISFPLSALTSLRSCRRRRPLFLPFFAFLSLILIESSPSRSLAERERKGTLGRWLFFSYFFLFFPKISNWPADGWKNCEEVVMSRGSSLSRAMRSGRGFR